MSEAWPGGPKPVSFNIYGVKPGSVPKVVIGYENDVDRDQALLSLQDQPDMRGRCFPGPDSTVVVQ